ncbi:MAG: alginate lyase family protein [Alphaproteobacteria bacterium]
MRRALAIAFVLAAGPAVAADLGPGLFDVDQRRAELQRPDYEAVRAACLAVAVEDALPLPEPVAALSPTDDYGTDHASQDFAWSVMVLGGRSLAGDADATALLVEALTGWATAGALEQTPTHYDPFFALKRTLLPTIVSYRIAADSLTPAQDALVRGWLDGLVRRIDATFDGDVDRNNHRYLADLVLMTWGSVVGDDALYAKGEARYATALGQARADGSLPLESRRGARALWYSNIATGELSTMAQVARAAGRDLAATEVDGRGHDLLLGFLVDALETPGLVLPYAVENTIPGPGDDYRDQDFGFTEPRGHGRHYMAWTEALLAQPADTPARARLAGYFAATLAAARPLIDEYAGGNATCFWMRPAAALPGQ